MSEANDSVILLSRALDQTGDVLTAIKADDLPRPTPCAGWDVGRLVSHVVSDPRHFLEMAAGRRPDWSDEPERVQYWTATFRAAADDLLHHWHQVGDDADPAQVDWQTAEFAVHTWDLARATGQSPRFDADVAERALAFMSAALTDDNRGQAFGPPQPAPDDAPVHDRLAAYAGRPIP